MQADAGPRVILSGVQALKDNENFIHIFASMPIPLSCTEEIHSWPTSRAEIFMRGKSAPEFEWNY